MSPREYIKAGVGVRIGRSKSSFMACISIFSISSRSLLLIFHDSEFVRRAGKLTVLCKLRRMEVSILLSVPLAAIVFIDMVDEVILPFLDSIFFVFFPSLDITSPRYL